eukprot:CAMPEP_0194340632 /NCGR_PEP_ID=MMETSP0171-20130528/87054_1 /TAXON_ID=218684 /ORGANISM="Corethron pennatum, Strain L29A3" /LENGTH=190 /DNA_ID=CAMNT_0039105663 /DNA_START=136 /DNA_END=708 /DNA_ORIENTATION=-
MDMVVDVDIRNPDFSDPDIVGNQRAQMEGHDEPSVNGADSYEGADASGALLITNGRPPSLQHASSLLEQISRKEACVPIPPRWAPPPGLEGRSCVYILEVRRGGSSTDTEEHGRHRYYVGETDSLARRFRQHRAKGRAWARAHGVAVEVEGGRSGARHVESRLIRRMARRGFEMISLKDGGSVSVPVRRN